MRVHTDERRTAYCDLFDTPGDVNLFVVYPGQGTFWHRHQKQTDQFRVIRGAIQFGIWAPGMQPKYTVLTRPDEMFWVEPGEWHGYRNTSDEPAHLLMYLNRKYDPTDEERSDCPWGEGDTGGELHW